MAKQKKEEKTLAPLTLASSYKRILGLDLSLTGTGWCLIPSCGDITTNMATYGTINTKDLAGAKRLIYIRDSIKEHLESNTFIVLEGFSFGSKGSTIDEVYGLGWLIRCYLSENNFEWTVVPPTTLKKFVTGKGNVEKNIMLKEIYKLWNMDFYSDNEADAFSLAIFGRGLKHLDDDFLKASQKEVINKFNG